VRKCSSGNFHPAQQGALQKTQLAELQSDPSGLLHGT
jgi:AhpD family alkylhydroperoxidase